MDKTLSRGCQGTSISFNEPTLLLEWSLGVFRLARKRGLYNTYVANGYMTPDRLLELRRARADSFSIPEEPYASPGHIRQEILHSRRLGRDHGWQQIEVAGKSVEEVAREIIVLLSTKEQARGPAW